MDIRRFFCIVKLVFADRVAIGVTVVGVLLSLVFFACEWGGLPFALDNPEALFLLWPEGLARSEPLGLFFASLSCAFTGVRLVRGSMVAAPLRSSVRMLGIAIPLVVFFLGFIRLANWSTFLPFVDRAAEVLRSNMNVPPALVIVPTLVTFLFGLVMLRIVQLAARALPGEDNDRKVYAAILITAPCLGMLCWNLLTCVVPIAGGILASYRMLKVHSRAQMIA